MADPAFRRKYSVTCRRSLRHSAKKPDRSEAVLDVKQLEGLQAVACAGSLTRAAEILDVTPLAVCQQLAKIGEEFGQPVLQPYGRTIRLTRAALLFSQEILSAASNSSDECENFQRSHTSGLTLAAFPAAMRGLIPHVAQAMAKKQSGLRLRIREQESGQSLPLLDSKELDVAVIQDWVNRPLPLPSSLRTELILEDVADLALPAHHALAGRDTIEIAEVADESWIGRTPDPVSHDWLTDALHVRIHRPRIAHLAAEYQSQLALVQVGLGIALLPRLGRDVVPAGLRIIPITLAPTRRIYAAYHRDLGNACLCAPH